MAVTLDGGTGLFDRLGRIGFLINTINGRRGGASAGDYPVELNDVLVKFDAGTNDERACVAGLLDELTALQQGHDSMLARLKEASQQLLIEMFDADDPLPELSVEQALLRLRKQMLTATTRYVTGNTLSATYTSTGNTGTGNIVAAVVDGNGRNMENLLAEDLEFTVDDTTTAAAEVLRCRGEVAESDKLHWNWPAGSGVDANYTSVDASDAEVNLLANGDFEDFTVANTPDNWTIAVGSAGTEVLREATTKYAGTYGLEIVGAATLTQLYQSILANVESRTVYALNFWAKVDVPPAAGVLTIDLHDGSAVIQDEQGNNQTTTYDLTAFTTSFVAKSFTFRLPEPLPAIVRLRVRISTGLSVGSSLFIDHMALVEMTQPGDVPGATPFLAVFSGATNWAADDGAGNDTKVLKVAVANNRSGTPAHWNEMFDRLFDTSDLGFVLPISGSTVVNSNLIA